MRTTTNCDHETIDHPEHADSIDWQTPVDLLEPEEEEDAPLDVSEIGRIPPDALGVFVRFLIPATTTPSRWRTACARLCALAHALNLPEVSGMSQTDLAAEVGCSKALLSLNEIELRSFGGLANHGGKSDQAREAYALRARRVWGRRGRLQAAEGGGGGVAHQDDSKASTVAQRTGKRALVKS